MDELAAFEAQVASAEALAGESINDEVGAAGGSAQDAKAAAASDADAVVVEESVVASEPVLNAEYQEALNKLAGRKRKWRPPSTNERKEQNGTQSSSAPAVIGPALPPEKKQKKILRTAAGKVWQDKTLEKFPDNDFRLWVGHLGPEARDSHLHSIFNAYPSFNMVHVVMNKRTQEGKGYGFVSFSDPMEMVRAMRENQGKYCGTRRMLIKRGEKEKRDLKYVRKQEKKMEKLKKKLGAQ